MKEKMVLFFSRFFQKQLSVLLLLCLLLGVVSGAFLSCFLLPKTGDILPTLFSGIPEAGGGFIACFSTFLCNALIYFILLFLLGITAFGVFAVPVLSFFKGMATGVGVLSFFLEGGLSGLGECAFLYTPTAALFSFFFLLFAVRASVFSKSLAKAGFSSCEGSLDFSSYLKDFLTFLSFLVVISLLGSLLAQVYALFFT